ncbi:MAG: SCO2322 family protein [Nocardioidaceae bacterium]
MAFLRRTVALVALTILALPAATAAAATTAAASTAAPTTDTAPMLAKGGYTYWGFYVWNAKKSGWDYMKVGANDRLTAKSKDGDVYGLRWALVVKKPRLPRAAGDFQAICGDEDKTSGSKRLALVIDYGTKADAPGSGTPPQPRGVCAVVDTSRTVQQALQSAAKLRTGGSGIICGIDGYPASGCGSQVKDATEPPPDTQVTLQLPHSSDGNHAAASDPDSPSSSSDDGDDGSGITLPLIIAIVLAIAAGATAFQLRKRQRS